MVPVIFVHDIEGGLQPFLQNSEIALKRILVAFSLGIPVLRSTNNFPVIMQGGLRSSIRAQASMPGEKQCYSQGEYAGADQYRNPSIVYRSLHRLRKHQQEANNSQ
jgi:hypothetical protein